MTNAEIIMNERIHLMEQNKIGTTGRKLKAIVMKDGVEEVRIFDEPEEIHTFAAWKKLGYSIKKGEKAVAKFHIWKYTEKVVEAENGEDEETIKNMFMKASCFFAQSQVEKTEQRAG